MKKYPSIPPDIVKGEQIYAFDKLDGSQIRCEWSKKRGFYKFGTRRRLLDGDEQVLGEAVSIIQNKYSEDLQKIFKKQQWRDVVCFFEFFGPGSFAGAHRPKGPYDVVLFDTAPDKKGILEPRDFIKRFGHLDIAKMLYRGNANSELIEAVRNSALDGMTFEGVVCKGKHISPGLPRLFKIKSNAWYDRLKRLCGDDQELYEKLV
jgi:hypothetical protein